MTLRLLLISGIFLFVFSCTDKATKYYTKGKKEFQEQEFEDAVQDLSQAKSYGAPAANVDFFIAESYRLSNRMQEALPYYRDAIAAGTTEEKAYFYYGLALKSVGKYQDAIEQLQKYSRLGTNFDYINRAKLEIVNLKKLFEIANKRSIYDIENAEELNTPEVEYGPAIGPEGKFYFTSSRGVGPEFPAQGTRFTDLFNYKFDGITKFSGQALPFPETINQEKTHEANITFSPDGNTIIFSRSNTGKISDETQEVDLFQSSYVGGEWTEPERLAICERFSWDSSPYWTKDGKTLYFASNREGGIGQIDIWKSEMDENGIWGQPENLGPEINTAGEDLFPYVADDGTFYYSSDGLPGFGGLDLYFINKQNEPENMGKPINTSYDDFSIVFLENGMGYFSSNRPEGKGFDDIYAIKECDRVVNYFVEGFVRGYMMDEYNNILDTTKALSNANVTLIDTVTNTEKDVTMTSDSGHFRLSIEPEKVYSIKVSYPDYLVKQFEYSTVGESIPYGKLKKCETDTVLDTLTYKIEPEEQEVLVKFDPVYFEYDKWRITSEAKKVLNEMVQVMEDNPDISVEISAHTDPRNTFKYNDILSKRRARSVVKYMIKKGISPERISAKGYGERRPYVLKKDREGMNKGTVLTHEYIESLEDESAKKLAYRLNRRVEFKITDVDGKVDPENIEVIEDKTQVQDYGEEKKHEMEDLLIKQLLNRTN